MKFTFLALVAGLFLADLCLGKKTKPETPHYEMSEISPRGEYSNQTVELNNHHKREPLRGDDQPEGGPTAHIQGAIRRGDVPSRGVNLGGWLITEAWMTRSSALFQSVSWDIANEGEQQVYTHSQPRDVEDQRFQWHRDNFVTEDEIAKIAAAGLNTVRVPVGYWIVGFDKHDTSGAKQWKNYSPGGLAYLDRLICDWAKKHNIAVLISMHGGKGSQNGADHSAPEQPGKSLWSHYPENVASTLDAVQFLAARYKDEDAFLGIGLLNEPGGDTDWRVLYKYYDDAYRAIRYDGGNDCILTIMPLLWEQSADYMTGVLPGATNVWVEWHRYYIWGYEKANPNDLLNSDMDGFRRDVEAEFGKRQLRVLMETVDGGFAFWSWRVYEDEYNVNAWSLRSLIENGIFPKLS